MGDSSYDPATHDAQGNRLVPGAAAPGGPGWVYLFGSAADETARGRAALASAVDTDAALRGVAEVAGGALWDAARALIAAHTGPLGVTVADAARVIVEREIRRRASA